MGIKDSLWCIGGASRGVTGCKFSLYPMSDQFITIILDSIETTDTTKVWKLTDKLATCVRGKRSHIADVVKGFFINSYRTDIHMALEATYSKGCPGDIDADSFMDVDNEKSNEVKLKGKHFDVNSKMSFYPMGEVDYMEHIAKVVMIAKKNNVFVGSSHYASLLSGDVHDVFDTIEEICKYGEENLAHYILQVTVSVNSPTKL
ncbi:MAG: Ykof family thiamine-binding protein [Fusobacteriaceae bacterium]|jgi:hypothetical protein|nr:Ykof family thiamine-binding protein [Fusobacteriaceae bacterium]